MSQLTRKNAAFIWTQSCELAFQALKHALTSAPVLAFYDPTLPTKLETDAADGVVAGVLSQLVDGEWHLIAYYSKTMGPRSIITIFMIRKCWLLFVL
jgi:hypothetical protein